MTTDPSHPLLDFEQLESFLAIGLTDFRDILGDVIHDVPGHVSGIREAILGGDRAALKARAHSMRGMLSNFGCIGMTAVLHPLEIAESPAPALADGIASGLTELWNRSLQAIREWEESAEGFEL